MEPEPSGEVAACRPRKGRNFPLDDMSATPDPSRFLPVERTRQTLMKVRAFAAQRYCSRQFAADRREPQIRVVGSTRNLCTVHAVILT